MELTDNGLLIVCICQGDEFAAKFLIENGADVNSLLHDTGQTPLHLAASFIISPTDNKTVESISHVTQLLLQRGATANAQDCLLRSVTSV